MGLLLHCPSLQPHRRYATCLFVLLGLCQLLFKLSQTDNFGKHPPRDLKQIKMNPAKCNVTLRNTKTTPPGNVEEVRSTFGIQI